ncbi:hypothetical protein ACF7P6_07715 [Staphylococcus aureus]
MIRKNDKEFKTLKENV